MIVFTGTAAWKFAASIGIEVSEDSFGIGAMTGIIIFCKRHMIGDRFDDVVYNRHFILLHNSHSGRTFSKS